MAQGNYIQFLDQDDELLAGGYRHQLELLQDADIAVGNGHYSMGEKKHMIYKSYASMKYLINLEKFINIRNLIPSPGECLIKRSAIPEVWINNPLSTDGADDWMLWVSMFKQEAKFVLNPQMVYRHNDANGANCSADLHKMMVSASEANRILLHNGTITCEESKVWKNAIDFKFMRDTNKLNVSDMIKYKNVIYKNICYKISLCITDGIKNREI